MIFQNYQHIKNDAMGKAALHNKMKVIHYLFKRGIDVYYGDNEVLNCCCINNRIDILKLLFERKLYTDIDVTRSLQFAITQGHLEVVKLLSSYNKRFDIQYLLKWTYENIKTKPSIEYLKTFV